MKWKQKSVDGEEKSCWSWSCWWTNWSVLTDKYIMHHVFQTTYLCNFTEWSQIHKSIHLAILFAFQQLFFLWDLRLLKRCSTNPNELTLCFSLYYEIFPLILCYLRVNVSSYTFYVQFAIKIRFKLPDLLASFNEVFE